MGLYCVTEGYSGLQRVKESYKRVMGGYMGLKEVTGG